MTLVNLVVLEEGCMAILDFMNLNLNLYFTKVMKRKQVFGAFKVNNLKKFNIFKLKNHSSTESQKRGRK